MCVNMCTHTYICPTTVQAVPDHRYGRHLCMSIDPLVSISTDYAYRCKKRGNQGNHLLDRVSMN